MQDHQTGDPLSSATHVLGAITNLWAVAQAAENVAPWWMPLLTLALWGVISYALKRLDGAGPREALRGALEELDAERRRREAAERRLADSRGRSSGVSDPGD